MNQEQLASELVKIAKSMVAMPTMMNRVNNAEAMIQDGGRGIELGIREIEYLAKDIAETARHMRIIQGSGAKGYVSETVTIEDMLEFLKNRIGR